MIKETVKSTFIVGTIWFLCGIAATIVFGFLTQDWTGLFSNDYASRWSGQCNGWSPLLALTHCAGELAHWWAYAIISRAMLALHPVVEDVSPSRWAMRLSSLIFLGCGFTHLFNAYCIFDPRYALLGLFILGNGALSIAGAWFIVMSLSLASVRLAQRQREIDKKLAALSKQES